MGILTAPPPSAPTLPSCPDGDDVQARLRGWHQAATTLCFVYARSLGGLLQSGRGHIAMLSDKALKIDAGGSILLVMLSGATYDDAPQTFFTPDLGSHFEVDGISIALGNHDWLFFSPGQMPQLALPAPGALRRL